MSFDLQIFNGDLVLSDGDLAKVENTDKTIQDVLKVCVTPAGSNPLFRAYGSLLSNALIGNPFPASFTAEMATSQLRNSLELLQKLQKIQQEFQPITPAEQILAIRDVRITQNQEDPRYWSVEIYVVTGEMKTAMTGFSVTL